MTLPDTGEEVETDELSRADLERHMQRLTGQMQSNPHGTRHLEPAYQALSRAHLARRVAYQPHEHHQQQVSDLVQQGRHQDAVDYMSEQYFQPQFNQYQHAPQVQVSDFADRTAKGRSVPHASTGGFGHRTHIRVSRPYLKRMATSGNMEDFAKLVSTQRHERVHHHQREKRSRYDSSTKPEREMMAYSEELLDKGRVPPVYGPHRRTTREKMKKYYRQMAREKRRQFKKRLRKADHANAWRDEHGWGPNHPLGRRPRRDGDGGGSGLAF